jgi:ketose-bisphosphate aldolase
MNKYMVIKKAYNNGYAVPQFNIVDGVYAKYILEECQRLSSPVILGVSEKVTNHMGGYKTVKSTIDALKKDLGITVPVILHFDHGKTVDACEKAAKAGFDSVMLDYSAENLDINIKYTKYLVRKYKNTIIETEIGSIGKDGNKGIIYAETKDALELSKETNAHLIAPSLGSVHGPYKGEPQLNFKRMKDINEALKKPLVLHGGSGLNDEMFKECIKNGIAKININTELKMAWTKGVKEALKDKDLYDPVVIVRNTEKYIKEAVSHLISVFGCEMKA